jgi:hypothetical protein
MYLGLMENEVMEILDNTLRAAGVGPFFDVVIFGTVGLRNWEWLSADPSVHENASNPHGGTDGNKVLEAETLVLIDLGQELFSPF